MKNEEVEQEGLDCGEDKKELPASHSPLESSDRFRLSIESVRVRLKITMKSIRSSPHSRRFRVAYDTTIMSDSVRLENRGDEDSDRIHHRAGVAAERTWKSRS
jgi:hypothetical protein